MSRIGKKPVPIPKNVEVSVDGTTVKVKGPKGELTSTFVPSMKIKVEDGSVIVERPSDDKPDRALHGLTRALIANMVLGVTEGFRKTLEIVGVGYRAEKKGKNLVVNVGYSHPVEYPEPAGITLTTPQPDRHCDRRHRQAEGRSGCGRAARVPPARAVQRQGHPLSGRAGPAQGRQDGRQIERGLNSEPAPRGGRPYMAESDKNGIQNKIKGSRTAAPASSSARAPSRGWLAGAAATGRCIARPRT